MLAFAPQGWTSDGTDAVERLRIQWGTSLAYPLSSMAAHVSAVPNHQVGRVTPLATRAAVAFFGVFGYELDPTALDGEERAAIADQIAFYRRHRELFQRGRFVRLVSPFEGDRDRAAWMVVVGRSPAGRGRHVPDPRPARPRARSGCGSAGLDPAATYGVTAWPDLGDRLARGEHGRAHGRRADGRRPGPRPRALGDRARGDFWARLFVLEAGRLTSPSSRPATGR